jgi:Uma2 family endonuclease
MTTATPTLRVDPESRHVLWTRDLVQFLISSDLIDATRYELFEGQLIEKMKHRPHIIAQRRLYQALLCYFAPEYLQSEAPIDIAEDDNETNAPEPDLAILTRPDEAFLTDAPTASDVSLVVEVADSTLHRDLGAKARLYAKAGIPEYWVVDIEGRQVHVHRDPDTANETWQSIMILEDTQSVAPLANQNATIAIADIVPPAVP